MLSPLPRPDGHGQLTGVVPFDRRPSVALAIVTFGPAVRLRALLEIVRPHVDEIVVGIDRDWELHGSEACADLADRQLSLDLRKATAPQALAWVYHQCTADWILGLDAHEVPGTALLANLSTLVADRRPAALGLETRWVYPDPSTYIVSAPWANDMRPRIVRNLPGIWRFGGRDDFHVATEGELRYADLPIYNFDLVASSKEERLRRSRIAEQRQPGVATQCSPVSGIHLPEALGELLETRPVGAADRSVLNALVAPVVAADTFGSDAADGDGPAVAIDQLDQREGPLQPRDYQAALDVIHPPATVPAQAERRYLVLVRHEGSTRWPAGDREEPLVRLGYRWVEESSGEVTMEGRSLLSESVMAGETTLQPVPVRTPPRPGRHRLEIDLVHEHVRWFDRPVVVRVEVEGDEREALRAATPVANDAAELGVLERQLAEVEHALQIERQLRATRRGRLAQRLAAPLDRLRGHGS